MPETPVEQAPKKRLTWRFFVLVIVGSVTLFVLSAVWWYNSDADLEAVRARAASMNVPVAYDELYTDRSGVRIKEKVGEILDIFENELISYEDDYYDREGDFPDDDYKGMNFGSQLFPGDKPDGRLVNYYRSERFSAAVDRVLVLLKEVESESLYCDPYYKNGGTQNPFSITNFSDGFNFLCDYSLSRGELDVVKAIEIQIRLLDILPKSGFIEQLVKNAMLGMSVRLCQLNLDHVPLKLLLRLQAQSDEIIKDFKHSFADFFISALITTAENMEVSMRMTSIILGTEEPSFFDRWKARVSFRYNRTAMLDILLDIYEGLEGNVDDLGYVLQQIEKYEEIYKDSRYVDSDFFVLPIIKSHCEDLGYIPIILNALVAIKKNESLTVDHWGNQYKGIYKNKKFIGFYSMGEDGIDDGWQNEDEQAHWIYDYIDPDEEAAKK